MILSSFDDGECQNWLKKYRAWTPMLCFYGFFRSLLQIKPNLMAKILANIMNCWYKTQQFSGLYSDLRVG